MPLKHPYDNIQLATFVLMLGTSMAMIGMSSRMNPNPVHDISTQQVKAGNFLSNRFLVLFTVENNVNFMLFHSQLAWIITGDISCSGMILTWYTDHAYMQISRLSFQSRKAYN